MTAREEAERYQGSLDPHARKTSGTFYTPAGLIDCVLDLSLEPLLDVVCAAASDDADLTRRLLALRICDPTCGAALFLIAATDRIAARGASRDEVMSRCIYGVDLDPEAIALAGQALPGATLRVGNALVSAPRDLHERVLADAWVSEFTDATAFHWQIEFPDVFGVHDGFDLVVGNPPFLNQLETDTATPAGGIAMLRGLIGELGPYTDASAIFLRRALDLTRSGGRVAMVQPVSLLAARDAAPVRRHLAEHAALTGIWVSATPVFPDASVLTCAVSLVHDAVQGPVELRSGPTYDVQEPIAEPALDGSWGHLLASVLEIPLVALPPVGTLADLGEVTADFRDQYYGLEPFIHDGGDGFPLITTGLIDPGRILWGEREARFLKQGWRNPTISAEVLDSSLGDWARRRLVPKVLIGTQGRIIEAVVDEDGAWLPCVPVISMTTDEPWRVLAVLLAPPVVAHAAATYAGTGLSLASIKLSAKQVAALPLPASRELWDEGASLAHCGELVECARVMTQAYGVEETVFDWWRERARVG